MGPLARIAPSSREGGVCRAPSERSEPRRNLLVGERLDDVVVGAGIEPGDPVRDAVPRREHQDRDAAAAGPHPPGDLEPVDVGQADIEDQGIEAATRLDELERLATADREIDDVAFLGQESLEEPTQPGIVLDDEHVHVLVLRSVSEGSLKVAPVSARVLAGRALGRTTEPQTAVPAQVARSMNQPAVGPVAVR